MKRLSTSFLLVALACTFGLLGGGIVMYIRSALASRNSSGTYSLATSPVTTLQTISTSLWNNTFSDLATGITDSADRNGRGGFLAPVRGIDGTVAAPAFAYTSETGSGEYRIGAGDLGWAILGGKKLELTGSLFTVTPNATFSGTLGVTSDFSINTNKFTVTASTGNTLVAGSLGVGGAPTNQFDITIPGSGNTVVGEWLQSSLSDGNSVTFRMGKADASGSDAIFRYSKNATALNSTLCMEVFGGSNALCLNGNNAVTLSGTLAVGTGTTTNGFTAGNCTLNGGTPAQCTATVVAGTRCNAHPQGTTAAIAAVGLATSVSGTTLTVTADTGGSVLVVNFLCF